MSPSTTYQIDMFCHVIDNFGDIGVSWRLARQLSERGNTLRLWVDDLQSFQRLCDGLDTELAKQRIAGVEIIRWDPRAPRLEPGEVVIEMFGCDPPAEFVAAMAGRAKKPLWINLEYFSAEPWVNSSHGLPSPHPRLPITRWFFFPGCRPGTGGLLTPSFGWTAAARESARANAMSIYGLAPCHADELVMLLFAYPIAPLADAARIWSESPQSIRCLIPVGASASILARACARSMATAGTQWQNGNVTFQVIPFVDQSRFDQVLAGCDLAFVRGEDSFAQAQWHGRPFVWHLYPQDDFAHLKKLDAFLALYTEGLDQEAAQSVVDLWHAWNAVPGTPDLRLAWMAFLARRPLIAAHANSWARRMATLGDLAGNLQAFIAERL